MEGLCKVAQAQKCAVWITYKEKSRFAWEAVGNSLQDTFLLVCLLTIFLSLWLFCVLAVKGLEGAAPLQWRKTATLKWGKHQTLVSYLLSVLRIWKQYSSEFSVYALRLRCRAEQSHFFSCTVQWPALAFSPYFGSGTDF